ncbi:MAG: VWA domain-containing protein [Candidatus Alcyoniella australis]|nr:VWA domain-containing protein [Candidatus Alcyoniella australis]
MFERFFYALRSGGVPVTPTSFVRLQQALDLGLINSLEDFYVVARSTMIKSERWFDTYDQIFAHVFQGKDLPPDKMAELRKQIDELIREWLSDPDLTPEIDPETRAELLDLPPEELERRFLERLAEQTERHDGGNRWIGTGGTSPFGHGGTHPGGMRVGGASGGSSAIKVAGQRRWKDYSGQGVLSRETFGQALRRLKQQVPVGPRDRLDIEQTIYQTVRNGGEIELMFSRSLKNRVRVLILLDNGGFSMDPYVELCRALFAAARDSFKEMKVAYFHNCVYDLLWYDPRRSERPLKTEDVLTWESDWRILLVGDASMASYELTHDRGSIEYYEPQSASGAIWLRRMAQRFPHMAWLNPKPRRNWERTIGNHTIAAIGQIIPMHELSLQGLESAVGSLMAK